MELNSEIFMNSTYTRLVGSTTGIEVINENGEKDLISQPVTVISKIKTSEFFKRLMSEPTQNKNFILPRNCKYYKNLAYGNKLLVLEEEPKIRTISVMMDLASTLELHKLTGKYEEYNLQEYEKVKIDQNTGYKKYRFSLSMPYVVYVLSLDGKNRYCHCQVYFRLHPITSLDDYLLTPCLSNLDASLYLCSGPIEEKTNLIESVDEIIGRFWMNNFNKDYYSHVQSYSDTPEISDYFTWAHNTRIDPLFIFNTKWKPRQEVLHDIIDRGIQDSSGVARSSTFTMNHAMKLISEEIYQPDNLNNSAAEESRRFTDSVVFDNGQTIGVGDKISIDTKNYYINSFKFDNEEIIMTVENEEGEISEIKLTEKKKIRIIEGLEVKNPSSVTINDTEIKVSDLVQFDFTTQIKSVDKIIQSKDGLIQIKVGKDFYLLTPFLQGKIKKVDIDKLKFHGTKIEKDKEYFIVYLSDSFLHGGNILKFNKIYSTNGSIVFTFFDPQNQPINIGLEEKILGIYPNEPQEQIFRWNNSLFSNVNGNPDLRLVKNVGFCAIGHSNRSISSYYDRRDYFRYSSTICLNFLSRVTDTLEIKSFDVDLNFKIGDEVIIVDWTKKDEMFRIKTIENFILDEENIFNFILRNDDGKLENYEFINSSNGHIDAGGIRKVCRGLNGVSIGTKTVASKSGIPDFPKKDCNEIKAFIVDGIMAPLVLLSNYRTLHFDDLQEFDLYSIENPKFSKLKLTTEFKEINIQPGDIILSDKIPSVVSDNKYAHQIGYPLHPKSFRSTPYNSKTTNRYGIISPRFSKGDILDRIKRNGMPGMFEGSLVKDRELNIRII